jgi:hypothetical protein
LAAALLAVAVALPAAAQDKSGTSKAPKVTPPPPPESLTKGKDIEPEVNIVEREWATFEEYSVHGHVYAVKVTPSWGPPYYLYDSDGDGSLESRRDLLRDVPQTPMWKILTW